jgi:hypothetical protein
MKEPSIDTLTYGKSSDAGQIFSTKICTVHPSQPFKAALIIKKIYPEFQ